MHPLEVPTAGDLLEKKIWVLMHNTVLDEKGVLAWFTGKVKSATDVEGGVEAEVEWDTE